MNNKYVITFDLIEKNVRESSEEKPSISTEEIDFIHNRLANAVYELDKMSLAGSVSIEELKFHNFDVNISKKLQDGGASESDKILEERMGTSYQLSISNKNSIVAVAQKMYAFKKQAIVILYQENSPMDSIKKGVEKFLDRLLTNLCDTFGFQFKDKHSNLYQVDMTLTFQGKETVKEQSSANFQKLVESLVDESFVSNIDNEWKYLSPEGNNGLCIDSPVIEFNSTCGNFHTKVSTTT
jgi:hypothetical protein